MVYGDTGWLFPSGFFSIFMYKRLPPGQIEDFIRLCANEHLFLSKILADKLNPFSQKEKQAAAFVINSQAFFWYILVRSLETDAAVSISINIFLVAPLKIILDEFLYFLLALPCCARNNKSVRGIANCCAQSVVVILILLSIVTNLLSALIWSNCDGKFILLGFYLEVLVSSYLWKFILLYLPFIEIEESCCSSFLKKFDNLTCHHFKLGDWHNLRKKHMEFKTVCLNEAVVAKPVEVEIP